MDSSRGKPLFIWALILTSWVIARYGMFPAKKWLQPGSSPPAAPIGIALSGIAFFDPAIASPPKAPQIAAKVHLAAKPNIADSGAQKMNMVTINTVPSFPMISRKILGFNRSLADPAGPGAAMDPTISPAISPTISPAISPLFLAPTAAKLEPQPHSNIPPRLQIYTFSFWRPGKTAASGLAAAPQYGGSQSGVIASYRITAGQMPDVAALGRASIAPRQSRSTEFAAGIRIKPSPTFPVSLTAERRFKLGQPDSTAIYAAGSKENIPIALGFTARSYAQAGVIMAAQADQFYDAGLRIDRSPVKQARSNIYLGFGAWTGGQRGSGRLDIGPAIRSDITAGNTRLQITADWRFRVAGNARPQSGPALTLSSGF